MRLRIQLPCCSLATAFSSVLNQRCAKAEQPTPSSSTQPGSRPPVALGTPNHEHIQLISWCTREAVGMFTSYADDLKLKSATIKFCPGGLPFKKG